MNISLHRHPRLIFAAAFFLLYRKKYFTWYSLKSMLMRLPSVENKLKSNAISLEQSLTTPYKNISQIPIHGLSLREVLEKTDCVTENQKNKKHISGIVYSDNEHHLNNMTAVFRKYASSNPLHPDIFPEVREMEIDIINMTRNMFNGDENVCGNVTSGGTESILLAMYTYREWGRKNYGITRPNIVAFHSVHPAFEKACHYFGISLRKVKSTAWMKMRIDWNTVCVIGSAPTYAYGLTDPIEEITEHCFLRNVPVHLDCCMGGFLIPFLCDNNINFTMKGITSISADTHKYGNCIKGSSVLLFKNWHFKQHQHFIKTDWEGGMYATPTLLGSKSGAIIAATWASLLLTGQQKFCKIANTIRSHLYKIKEEFANHEDLEIIGDPQVNIIAFKSKNKDVDIYKVVQNMPNWDLSVLTNPSAFHFCITSVHTCDIINDFILDLKNAVTLVKDAPHNELTGTLAIYGSTTKIENSIFTRDVLNQYVGLLSSKNIFNFNS